MSRLGDQSFIPSNNKGLQGAKILVLEGHTVLQGSLVCHYSQDP